MNVDKKASVLLFFIALIIIYVEYSTSKFNNYELPTKTILNLDKTIFKYFNQKYDTTTDLNRYWGFAKEVVKVDTNESNTSLIDGMIRVVKEKNKNVLCIAKSCYRLLCIHYNDTHAMITLYNKDLKKRVKNYRVNEVLSSDIIVKSISSHYVEFIDLNTTRKWKFKIFDVNQTKYIPKELDR